MSSAPYMPFFVSDYLGDTGHLNTEQHGAYLLLIFHYWQTRKALRDDDGRLAVIAKLSRRQWIKNRPLIQEFFEVKNGVWTHRRIELELQIFEEKLKKNVQAGKISARKRNFQFSSKKPLENNETPRTDVRTDVRTDADFSFERSLNGRSNHPDPVLDKEINKQAILENTNHVERARPVGDSPQVLIFPKIEEKKSELPKSGSAEVQAVFAYWQEVHNHPQAKLDQKREKAILARLREGYTVERIQAAIRGIRGSPHHMGQNDRATVYDDIELICRSGANVDRFADMEAQKNGERPERLTGERAKIARNLEEIRAYAVSQGVFD